jgi:hypothetical protein
MAVLHIHQKGNLNSMHMPSGGGDMGSQELFAAFPARVYIQIKIAKVGRCLLFAPRPQRKKTILENGVFSKGCELVLEKNQSIESCQEILEARSPCTNKILSLSICLHVCIYIHIHINIQIFYIVVVMEG